MIRVVFDTNILYSAILQRAGLPAAVFDLVSAGLLIPCVSPAVLAEYHDVLLARPALRPYAERALSVLEILARVAVLVEPTAPSRSRAMHPTTAFWNAPTPTPHTW